MSDTQDTHKHTNRLIDETSPYLLQHAHNPVNWYAWGDEALQKARREDKPILLSVGYSACHWCHVMERESFENEDIAAIMNQYFVSIKVDREERPDIDGIYMQAVQALTGQGGWPMTVFLTPDGRPFFGGTYFPLSDRQYGQQRMPGFRTVLLSMAGAYQQKRKDVEEQAYEIATFLQQRSSRPLRAQATNPAGAMLLEMFNTTSKVLAGDFDAVHGGFGGAPKFPNTMSLECLLRVHLHRLTGELGEQALAQQYSELEMVEKSLQGMANGGVYDHLGGGFHRYAVDAGWLTPHFEKMLYDNALLSRLYLHTYLVTGNVFYRRIVEETLDYVAREMTAPEGGFYSTQDADSEGEEGKFFVWTAEEIRAELPHEEADLFMLYYGVTPRGNFEGKNILHVEQDVEKVAQEAQISEETLQDTLKHCRERLFQERNQRVKPGRDEKMLTAWNGLMLRSFAEAARHLQRPDYLQVAIDNAEFLLSRLRQERDGRLLRTYKDGRARLKGYLEDYACLADGLLALYETNFEPRWFEAARRFMDEAIMLFADEQNGGFFDTGSDAEKLISRPKEMMDNATPAGNSVATDVLLRLAALTGAEAYRWRADDYLGPLAEIISQHPQGFGHLLGALDFAISPVKEIAIAGELADDETHALLAVLHNRYLPNSVQACAAPDMVAATNVIPLLAERPLKNGRPTAYVCENFACLAPVNSPVELEKLV